MAAESSYETAVAELTARTKLFKAWTNEQLQEGIDNKGFKSTPPEGDMSVTVNYNANQMRQFAYDLYNMFEWVNDASVKANAATTERFNTLEARLFREKSGFDRTPNVSNSKAIQVLNVRQQARGLRQLE